MEDYINEIVKFLNMRRCKGQYTINTTTNNIIVLEYSGNMARKINNEEKLYYDIIDFIDDLGLEADLVDLFSMEIWEE